MNTLDILRAVATGERSDVIDPRTNSFQCRDLLYDQIWIYGYDADGDDDVHAGGERQPDEPDIDGERDGFGQCGGGQRNLRRGQWPKLRGSANG